jgi:pimeloyl-ACP methyl ester carboxylesterase
MGIKLVASKGWVFMFMPLDFLLRLLSNLLAVALLGSGAYILYQWYGGELVSDRWLYFSIALLGWSFLGFLPILLLHRPGKDEPKPLRSNRVQRLVQPDGSEIQVEFYESNLSDEEIAANRTSTLVLTHGWGPDSTVWYYAKKQLTDQFRVVVWDLPGLGKSKKPENRD